MAANDAVSMNVAENRQNVPMAIQENRAAVPMTVAEGGGTPGGLNRKADKVTGAVAGNLAGLDSTGNLTDSGKAPEDFLEAPASAGTQGQVLTADGEGGASWQDPTGGDPTEIIDDNAGSGDTDKVWSADKSHALLTEINSAEEDIEDIKDLFEIETGGNLFNKDGEYLDNKIIKGSTGAILSENGYGVQYIQFEGSGTYTLLFPCDYYGNTRRICLYDSTKTYLRTVEGSGSSGASVPSPCTWTISEEASANVAFIGYAFKKSSMDSAMFVKSDTYPSEYIPYGNGVCKFLGTIDSENVEKLDEAIDERIEKAKPVKSRMEFGAHNGAEYFAPECTVPAYRIAGQQGWEWAWIAGIQFSGNNSMYVLHDTTVDRTTDGTGNIGSLSDSQINALKITQTGEGYDLADFDPAELHIPTFEEVLQQCVRYGMKMCIRITMFPGNMDTQGRADKWNNFVNLLKSYNVQSADVSFYVASDSSGVGQANLVRTLFSADAEISTFLGSTKTAQNGIDWFTNNSITGNRAFIINKANLDLAAVKLLHTNGIRCYGYSDLTQANIDQFATWGVDIAQNGRYHTITN